MNNVNFLRGIDKDGFYVSLPSQQKTKVNFINATSVCVQLKWIGFDGFLVKVKDIPPKQAVTADTFAGHPFAVYEQKSQQPLQFKFTNYKWFRSPVYHPRVWRTVRNGVTCKVVENVRIVLPKLSLKEHCLRHVLRGVSCKSDIDSLSLPHVIKMELEALYNHSHCKNIKIKAQ